MFESPSSSKVQIKREREEEGRKDVTLYADGWSDWDLNPVSVQLQLINIFNFPLSHLTNVMGSLSHLVRHTLHYRIITETKCLVNKNNLCHNYSGQESF